MRPDPLDLDPHTLRTWDRTHYWHGFTQMAEYEPLIIREASGCILIDVHGNEYLDGVSSLWCNLHGHRHPRLDAALREQLDRVGHVTSLGMSCDTTIRLARRLAEITPEGLEHVFFSDDGSTANEVAIKIALQYWQQRPDPRPDKVRYVAFDLAYHGDTIGSVSMGGIARFHQVFGPLLFQPLRVDAPDRYRLPDGIIPAKACEHYLERLEALLEKWHQEVAAVVLEPLVQGAGGMIMHPPGFLKGVRELTRCYDVLLILDEVAVGFGRTGSMFACEHERVVPDLLCLAKGLTAGYLPMAATVTTEAVWSAFLGTYAESRSFFHGHTYGGNPLAAAVALASLEVFREEQVLERLVPKIARLATHLSRMRELPHVGDVRQCGMIGAVELVRDVDTKEPFPWEERRGLKVCEYAIQHGVWLRPLGNVLIIMPPLCIAMDQLDKICDTVAAGIVATLSSP